MSKIGFLNAIKEIAEQGVGRNQKNTMQNYMYRSADDVINTVTPILAKHSIVTVPQYEIVKHETTQRQTSKGPNYTTTCVVKLTLSFYDITDTEQAPPVSVVTAYGEANDTGDKCVMKAETAAYKYALIYGLGIPVTGATDPDYDAGSATPDFEPDTSAYKKPQPQPQPQPQAQAQPKKSVEISPSLSINVDDTQKAMLDDLGISL